MAAWSTRNTPASTPGRYHQGLLDVARSAGVEIVSQCKVQSINNGGARFRIGTSKGEISAADVVVGTSGYTEVVTPWQRKRVIPIGSYMIATEPLPDGLTDELFPGGRIGSDSRKLVVYYRTSPDRKRVLFGGRASLRETDPHKSAPLVRELMVRRLPELESAKISHSWMGFVGYTFDKLPHLGKQSGIHYCMGYCGSGVTLASYLGSKIGLKAVSDEAGIHRPRRPPLSGPNLLPGEIPGSWPRRSTTTGGRTNAVSVAPTCAEAETGRQIWRVTGSLFAVTLELDYSASL